MKRLLKEPLLHFLLLGAVIFIAYRLVGRRADGQPGRIAITQGEIASMTIGFARTWQRPPTREELEGLIRDRVREEVYYREALAMGLERDDTIIRRRLRQKLEFVSEEIAAQNEPSDAELDVYFRSHLDAFRVPPRFTFSQVYLNPEIHARGENMTRDAAQLLAHLNRGGAKADISGAGDAFLLEREFADVSADEVAKQFGPKFAAQLVKLAPGQWQGPVESGYGMHLILVRERTSDHVPSLAEVRADVRREWENARRLEANESFYQNLLKHYTVTVEKPAAAEIGKTAMNR